MARVCGCQFIDLVFITDNAWRVLVLGFIDSSNLIIPPPTAAVTPIINDVVAFSVQMFFAWKIFTKFVSAVSALIACISTVGLGGTIGISVQFAIINRDVLKMYKLKTP